MHFLAKNPKNQCLLGFLGVFPSEGITSDATWMHYVSQNQKTLFKTNGLSQWFFHANPA
jgi:hypothetical protein